MHTLKYVVDLLTAPLMLVVLLGVAALILSKMRRRRAAMAALVLAGALAYLSTTGLLARIMMAPLVRTYPPLQDDALPAVKYVVVLGSAYRPRPGLPVTAALDQDGLARIVEALRLFRKLPGAQLVLPGASGGLERPGNGYARLAIELGIKEDALVLIRERARDTASEAQQIAAYLGTEAFLLVTSTSHMPRAMALMRRAGARPIAAPATRREGGLAPIDLVPRAEGLHATESAFHEYLGLAAMAARLD
jgi:uncharacterized SAM-binding protein YcdF (DUF218 family)